MTETDLQQLVEDELNQRWADFEAQHPNLARVLAPRVLAESIRQSLATDPAFQQALASVDAVGQGIELVRGLVRKVITAALKIGAG